MNQDFDNTLRHYKINASELAKRAGLSPAMLSKFRSGKSNLSTENLNQLLEQMDAIAPGSRRHFCMKLAGQNPGSLAEQVQFLEPTELATLLNLVADRVASRGSRELVGTMT